MPGVTAADLGVLAVRVVEAASNSWFVLIVDGHPDEVAADLQDEISAITGPIQLAARRVAVSSSREFAQRVRDNASGVLIVTTSAAFTPAEWASVDVNRSRYQRDGATVLVLEKAAAEQLENMAPNLASWIGGSIWRLVGAQPLDAAEAEQRLVVLRQRAGMSDDDVVRLSEACQLPADPEFAEWLTLLGRGDLLVGRS